MAYGKKIHNLFRWKPQKKRSAAQLASMQKAQSTSTSAPNDDEDSDKENANMDVEREIKQLGERARKYEQNFRNERKKVGRVVQNLCAAKKELQDVTMARDTAQDLLQETRLQLQLKENKVSVLENSKESLEKKNNGLRVRVCRASQQKDKAVQKAREVEQKKKLEFHVQENGVITEASRAIMRDLVSLGVKARSVDAAVGCIAGHLGTTIDGKFTSRSTHRAVVEGGVASTMQIAEEMKSGGGVTISSDGTTHKNINYESRFMNITNEDGTHKSRFLGISAATHHTSEEQLDGWIRVVEYILGIFNSSPRAQSLGKMELHEFLKLLKGMHTNHAEDQKKLVRLVQALKQASEPYANPGTSRPNTVERAGGPEAWNSLSEDEQDVRNKESYRALCQEQGCKQFEALSEEEQRSVDLFLWAGCCMHKELNSVKGGNVRMMAWWGENRVIGPVKLMNRDNAAAATAGGNAGTRAAEVSQGGAVKLTSLAGALLNHKDDKKGQHDTYRFYMESLFGYATSFPDTSNTRYQTHCLAATEIIIDLQIYIQLLHLIKDKKESRTLNNLERNVLLGLQDIPTIHELCVLVVYSQSISMPYLRTVRGNDNTNILDLAPLHQQVTDHCRKIITDPNLLVGPDVTYTSGSLDSSVWEQPDAMYAVLRLAPTLPHLHDLVRAFFEGALETWMRFSAEFVEGGKIATASASERHLAWMETTNDFNEGALGGFRKAARDDGNMSLLYYNGKTMYKRNGTAQYMSRLAPEEHQFIRSKARVLDSSQLERGRRQKQVGYDRALVEKKHASDGVKKKKRDDKEELLKNLAIRLDPVQLGDKNITVDEINHQLDWHRKWGPDGSNILAKSKCGVKAARLEILRAAIIRFNESGRTVEECVGTVASGDDMILESSAANPDCDDIDTDVEME